MKPYRYLLSTNGVLRRICQYITTPLLFVLSLVACSVATDDKSLNSSIADTALSREMMISTSLYFDERVPEGFYQGNYADDLFVSISHVKNIDLTINDGLPVYELASNDFVEAMDWDEQAVETKGFYEQLVDVNETDLYYQFTRTNPDFPELIHLSRVFRTDMLDRSGVDRSDENGGYKGRITVVDISATDVQFIVEYLWMFTFSNNYRNAILESYTSETVDEFVHIMEHAKLDFSYDESCDTVELYQIRYTVPKASGLIWRDKQFIRSFSTKLTDGQIEICE